MAFPQKNVALMLSVHPVVIRPVSAPVFASWLAFSLYHMHYMHPLCAPYNPAPIIMARETHGQSNEPREADKGKIRTEQGRDDVHMYYTVDQNLKMESNQGTVHIWDRG